MLAALVGEPVDVHGLANSGDVAATAAALRLMGAEVALTQEHGSGLSGTVTGPLREPTDIVDCGNSGTSLRLLSGIAAGIDGLTVMTGDASLRRRPVDRIRAPLAHMGIDSWARDNGHRLPLAIAGGRPRPVTYASPVASAQIKSCVLLAGLHADGTTVVISPAPSRDHTERMLTYLGGQVTRTVRDDGAEVVELTPGSLTARPIAVAGDPSSAAFWLVAAAIGSAPAGVVATGLAANPARTGFVRVLTAMGAEIEARNDRDQGGEPVADLWAKPASLTGSTVAGTTVVDALDELPILAVAGALSSQGLEVRDAAELRVKESDRIATTAAAFEALGATMQQRPDGYRVPGGQVFGPGTVDADGDHRIAMMAAVAATVATGPVEITGFGSVASSYPTFLEDLSRLGGRYDVLG